jgi:hypothetical protein
VLNSVLKPAVPYQDQLAEGTKKIAGVSTFSSTPTLPDVIRLQATISEVTTNSISYGTVQTFVTKMAADINSIWYGDYNPAPARTIADWQPPGAFEVHASALRQTYAAFLAADSEVEDGVFVLEGMGGRGQAGADPQRR